MISDEVVNKIDINHCGDVLDIFIFQRVTFSDMSIFHGFVDFRGFFILYYWVILVTHPDLVFIKPRLKNIIKHFATSNTVF